MNLKTRLFEHQKTAFDKLKNIKANALFMDMGTGKTRTALEFIEYRRMKKGISCVVWVCPVSTKLNLKLDIKKHSEYKCEFIENYTDEFICIVGAETISGSKKRFSEMRKLIRGNKTMLIIDESHMIKNHKSVRTERILSISDYAEYRMIMTGTPVTQGIWDFYTQFRFLHEKILGYSSFYAFAANHLEYSEKFPGKILRALDTGYITRKINPYIYQITKKECLDLPPKSYTNRYYCMSEKQDDIYSYIKSCLVDEINPDDFQSYTIFRMLGYLHRISSGYFESERYDVSLKDDKRVDILIDILKEIDLVDNKLIIFYRYNSDLEMIKGKLNQNYVTFNGRMSMSEKEEALLKFYSDVNIIIININSGSYGLNLQQANYIIYYNNTFDYSKRKQSEDRIYRIGQEKNCHIIDILNDSGIDNKIESNLNKKTSMIRDIRDKINQIKDNKEEIEKFKKHILKDW